MRFWLGQVIPCLIGIVSFVILWHAKMVESFTFMVGSILTAATLGIAGSVNGLVLFNFWHWHKATNGDKVQGLGLSILMVFAFLYMWMGSMQIYGVSPLLGIAAYYVLSGLGTFAWYRFYRANRV